MIKKSFSCNRWQVTMFFVCWMCMPVRAMFGQVSPTAGPSQLQAEKAGARLASFEVATIKPRNPNGGKIGFYSYPGGRIVVGSATLKTLLSYAFDVQDFQISGGQDWTGTERYDVTAVPPASSESRTAVQPPVKVTPSHEQREMLQSLLLERFGLKYHREIKQGPVYLLVRGHKTLQLEDAKDKDRDPRGGVFIKEGGIVDGEAAGKNVSMTFLANQLSPDLGRPVLDQTGLKGSFDFHLMPSDPTNTDMSTAIFDAMRRLGLELKAGKGPVETIVIDRATRPTEN